MRKFFTLVAALTFLTLPSTALAQGIDVEFSNDPLFSEDDLKPGDCYTESFSVENESSQPAEGYLRTLDTSQTRDLATVLNITITDTQTSIEVYADTLAQLFERNSDGDSVFLGTVAGDESRVYAFEACFPQRSGNEFQLGTAEFDLCVGFSGGEESCTGDGSGDNGEDDGDDGGGGGGGGEILPDRDGDGTPDGEDAEPDNPQVAGVSTTSPSESNLSGLLSDLEDALHGLLASLGNEQVLGALDRRAPTFPETGDGSLSNYLEEKGVTPVVMLSGFAALSVLLLGLLLLSLYRRREEKQAS